MEKEKLSKGIMVTALIMVFGALPPMFDSTIFNVAVNSLAKTFSTDLSVMQWAVTGYVLALGIAVPFSGWLIRKYAGKTVFMVSLSMFMLGSLLAGMSWNAESLIAFRAFQGFSSGILILTITTLVVQLGGSNNTGKIMSLVSIPSVFGPIFGPVVGGLILQNLSWNWLFYINIPLGAIGLILLQWKLPKFEAPDKNAKLDLIGVLLLAVTSGSFIYSVTQITKTNSRTVGIVFLLTGVAALIIYIFYAQRVKQKAVISLDIFHSKNFKAAFILQFLFGFATNGPMLLLPMLFQNIIGLSVMTSALWLMPQGIGMLITRSQVGKLTDRIGARYVALPSILVIVVGTIPFAFFGATTPDWLIWIVLLVRGMGIGGFMIPVMSDSYVGLTKPQIPTASVATRIVQNVGSAFGSAVLATVVSTIFAMQSHDLVSAYHAGFITSLIFMTVSIFPALFLTKK